MLRRIITFIFSLFTALAGTLRRAHHHRNITDLPDELICMIADELDFESIKNLRYAHPDLANASAYSFSKRFLRKIRFPPSPEALDYSLTHWRRSILREFVCTLVLEPRAYLDSLFPQILADCKALRHVHLISPPVAVREEESDSAIVAWTSASSLDLSNAMKALVQHSTHIEELTLDGWSIFNDQQWPKIRSQWRGQYSQSPSDGAPPTVWPDMGVMSRLRAVNLRMLMHPDPTRRMNIPHRSTLCGMHAFIRALPTGLTALSVSFDANVLKGINIDELLDDDKRFPKLDTLRLRRVQITAGVLKKFILAHREHLTSLHMVRCYITPMVEAQELRTLIENIGVKLQLVKSLPWLGSFFNTTP